MPLCIEKKILLTGKEVEYACELVRCDGEFGVLRHVIDREYNVGGIRLVPGDVTYALYWTHEPYTLYTWRLKSSGDLIFYFNIADSITLTPREFRWRDLVVDILVHSGGVRVLDEDELPAGLDPVLRRFIEAATRDILDRSRELAKKLHSFVEDLHAAP